MELYIGVLYTALGWATLTKAAQLRAQKSIVIISAKYGVVSPLDHIAPYKAKINNAAMRGPISNELDAISAELIIDCRSSTYQGVWTPPTVNTVEIKVFSKIDGSKKVITHMSKRTRGEVVRLLLLHKNTPHSPLDLFDIICSEYECELIENTTNKPWVLEVIAH
jgi:cytoplasmic iron level regulating protein YaaA (DUF328/UPF0246 family)